jgi:hypothetical protein
VLRSPDEATQVREQIAQVDPDDVESVPRYRLDLGIALRESGKILVTLGQFDEARVQLDNSRGALSQLVSEDPANEHFTRQLALTMDALAGLEELESTEAAPTE